MPSLGTPARAPPEHMAKALGHWARATWPEQLGQSTWPEHLARALGQSTWPEHLAPHLQCARAPMPLVTLSCDASRRGQRLDPGIDAQQRVNADRARTKNAERGRWGRCEPCRDLLGILPAHAFNDERAGSEPVLGAAPHLGGVGRRLPGRLGPHLHPSDALLASHAAHQLAGFFG